MRVFTVSFFGHRRIENPLLIERSVERFVQKMLTEKEYVAFLVGRDGEFDQIVSSAIRRCKRKYGCNNSAHVWVMPYCTAEFRDNEESFRSYYDEIEVCEAAAGCHFKRSHQIRNQTMVERSDLVVFCVQHEHGGAWQAMKYAKRTGKNYMNLGMTAWSENETETVRDENGY